ncbi:MAG: AAA family ATPase [Nocardioides sp.]
MRLHSLQITAFGPFAATAQVDFDALADAGLFLLAGPTGAGKSSILDAVCFALYGAVPGERNAAGRLRADQAPVGAAPEVSMEVTLAGRRFQIVRGPRWERPKKRGTGTTAEQARVVLSEEVAGDWRVLSTRIDEAGHLLGELLGMNLTQFCQVVMLPQNGFAAFLRSGPDERRTLLQTLFRSGRFDRMEGWLRDHRIGCRREADAHQRAVAALTSRVSEVSGVASDLDEADLAVAAFDGRLTSWVAARLETAETGLADSVDGRVRAAETEATTRATYDEGRRVDERWRRVRVAHDELARLTAEHDAYESARTRLAHARQAAGVLPLREVHDRRRAEQVRADERWAGLADRVGPDVDAEHGSVAAELVRVRGLLPAEIALGRLVDETARTARVLAAARARHELVSAESVGLPDVVSRLEGVVLAAERSAARLPELRAETDRLRSCAQAHADVEHHTAGLATASAELRTCARAAVEARHALLDLRERRIEGMAAELAGALAVGADCPVCGSHEHPRPAASRPDAPDAELERAAQRTLDTANAEEHARGLRVRELESLLATTRARCGDATRETVDADLARVEGELAEKATSAAGLDGVRAELAATRSRLTLLAADAAALEVEIAGLVATAEQQSARVEELAAEVAAARGAHATLGDVAAELTDRLAPLEAARHARSAADAAELALTEAASTLHAAAQRLGFDSAEAALAVALPPREVELLASTVSRHETELAAARAVLSDAGGALPTAPPDLGALGRDLATAVTAHETSQSHHTLAVRRSERLTLLETELETALNAWAPVRERLDLATQVSAMVEGKAADNAQKMRLSTFVLAYRLGQVVDAANERLGRMSGHRYALEHSGRRGAGETRGGLSLLVRDDWSGESRDPATLSGGETFVVSLALALGLADVISHESGGARLETLFVDEGFGALDAETLDDVLDVLDTLREGGRVVGVVSHVPEMRERIPTQVLVAKSPSGSSVTHRL